MLNVVGLMLILTEMDVPVVVTVDASLSCLGLGVLPPTASWSTIVNEGYMLIRDAPWMVVAVGIILILMTLAFTFVAEAVLDIFDPRMGKGR
jgi:ABC-type dipeptide/oligopeptide/nickel transport systems, permease components